MCPQHKPIGDKKKEEKTELYVNLERVCDKADKKDVKTVMGDVNTSIT